MNKHVIFILLAILFLFVSNRIYAVIAIPYPITITNPDGSTLQVLFHGDEYFSYSTTIDGYLLEKNSDNYFTYAALDNSGNIKASEFIARNELNRTSDELRFLNTLSKTSMPEKLQQSISTATIKRRGSESLMRNFPLSGSPRSLVILVNYTDKRFTSPTAQEDFRRLLNEENYSDNGGTGSVRDYFMASSYGKFSPTFDVVGPFNLPNSMQYYGGNTYSQRDVNNVQMIVDACTAAYENGVDFSIYDTNNDGRVDNVFVYYAGYNEAEGGGYYNENTIWPHRYSIYPGYTYDGTEESITFNGKILFDYACASELKGYTGTTMCGIGTFCHEFGHVLGLPDYYHTETSSKATLGAWSIMASGSYNNESRTPPVYSVYDRFYLGFLTPEEINTPSNVTLEPLYQGKNLLHDTSNQAYLFAASAHNLSGTDPDPREFFMVEYRRQTGWDRYLPSEGMLIWHIDFRERYWEYNIPNNYIEHLQTPSSHMRVYIEPTDGLSTTTPGAPFSSGSFTPETWKGVSINRPITDISMSDEHIFFRFMGGVYEPSLFVLNNPKRFVCENEAVSEYQEIGLRAASMSKEITFQLEEGTHFDIKLASDTEWKKQVKVVPTSGNMKINIQIRYAPKSEGVHTTNIIIRNDEIENDTIPISGVTNELTSSLINANVVGSTLAFPPTQVDNTITKMINIKTTNITGDLSVSIVDSNRFEVSSSIIKAEDANSSSGFNLTIEYRPVFSAEHQATLIISGGGLPDQVIILTGSGYR